MALLIFLNDEVYIFLHHLGGGYFLKTTEEVIFHSLIEIKN